jgi:hypothetical protein
LRAVLRSNFRNVGRGAKKIERGEFVIHDAATKLDVDLTLPWEACFSPGQHAVMSMVFNSTKASNTSCPKCHNKNEDNAAQDEDIEWYAPNPQLRYIAKENQEPKMQDGVQALCIYDIRNFSPELPPNSSSRKRYRPDDEEKEIALYRRVRIKTEIKVPAVEPRNKPSATHVDNDDPYSDPGLLHMLEAEKTLENELLLEFQKTQEQREREDNERRLETELASYAESEFLRDYEIEVAVEEELNERMMLEELPSDIDKEKSESHHSDDSDDIEEDIDMDYRFS